MRSDKLFRAFVYFKRGYSLIAFCLSFTNFVILTYKFVVEPILGTDVLLLLVYVASVGLAVSSACVLVGRWDYRRGTFKHEALVNVLNNPAWRDLFTALYYIALGDNVKAITILRKYIPDGRSTVIHNEEQCVKAQEDHHNTLRCPKVNVADTIQDDYTC
jgi:hypothetical protein